MFCSEDQAGEAILLGDSDPLTGIKLCGIENGGVGVASSPLRVSEGVGAKVEEERHFSQLP